MAVPSGRHPGLLLASIALLALGAVRCSGCGGDSPRLGAGDASVDAIVPDHERPDRIEPGDRVEPGPDVYGGDWTDSGVLTDPTVWTPVGNDQGCGLHVARAVPDPFPRRSWAQCGPGCEEADASLPIAQRNVVNWGTCSAAEASGDLLVRLDVGTERGRVAQVIRVSDGATIAAAQVRNARCIFSGWATDAPLLFPIASPEGGTKMRGGTARGAEPGAEIIWGNVWYPAPAFLASTFAWRGGWGMSFTDGTVRVVTSIDQPQMTIVAEQSVGSFGTVGRGNLVSWPGWSTPPAYVLRAWSASDGLQALFGSSPNRVASVALSDARIVWIEGRGPQALESPRFDSARMYWSQVATRPEAMTTTEGPVLPVSDGLDRLATGGDFAATVGCATLADGGDECSVVVVQLSTKKVWNIRPRPDRLFHRVMAVSQTYILVGENQQGHHPSDLRRLVRFRTDQLDELSRVR